MNMIKVSVVLLVLVVEFVSSRTLSDPFKLELQRDKQNCTKNGDECTTRDECCTKSFVCYKREPDKCGSKKVCRGNPPVQDNKPTTPSLPRKCGRKNDHCLGVIDCCRDEGYMCDTDAKKCFQVKKPVKCENTEISY